MMNKLTLKLLMLVFLVGISFHILGQVNLAKDVREKGKTAEYNPPTNVEAVVTHDPSWYSVNLSWSIPEGDIPSASVYDKSSLVTHPGEAYQGADASAVMDDFTLLGYFGTQQRGYSLADQFTLTTGAELDSIYFFTFQQAAPEPNPGPNTKEVYVRIYDGAPNDGGNIIWGDLVTNVIGNVTFANIYRVLEENLTANKGLDDGGYAVMKVTAKLGLTLTAGTYWVEVRATTPIPIAYVPNSNIVFCPVTIPGVTDTGRGLVNLNGVWSEMVDPGNNGKAGLAMEVIGKAAGVYNIYRDGVKVNETPVTNLSYSDIAPGAGTYEYGVTTVYQDGGESEPVKVTVTVDPDPCGETIVIESAYLQGFEKGLPNCWRSIASEDEQEWTMALYSESMPATAHHGTRKALYKAEEGAAAKIITTKFDLTKLDEPKLSFWYAQKANEEKQDELRVYYRNDESQDWTLLAEYTEEAADWTEVKLALPEPSETYWLAFEGTGNGGHGVMIDEVLINGADDNNWNPVSNLSYTMNTPVEEWYNVHLAWDFPDNGIDGDNTYLMDNGPIITNPGEGYEGGDVSLVESGFHVGGNITNVSGYRMADDFILERPTYISQMVFYCYEHFQSNDPASIRRFNIAILDGSPEEGGQIIWGGTQNSVINQEETMFSNIYRAYPEEMNLPVRPLIRVVTDIDHILAAGTYWLLVSAESQIEPTKGGAVFIPAATVLGEPYPGNAIHAKGDNWIKMQTGKGQGAMPFEIYGKESYGTFDVYRDGSKVNTTPVSTNYYTDVAPGAGTYDYCIKAIGENGGISEGTCTQVEMAADPCETAIEAFPYLEDFEGVEPGTLTLDCWRHEHVDGGSFGTTRFWDIAESQIGKPSTAVSGNQKAIYTDAGGSYTKLVSPMFNISSLTRPALKFWHSQGKWDDHQNELRIYYRNTIGGEWVMLAEYTENIPDWTEEFIKLPEASATYWIAFEAYGDMGRYVMLDDIRVEDVNIYTITADAQGKGSISPEGNIELIEGQSQTFTFTPDQDYKVDYILIDDEDKGALSSYTFTDVSENHSITAVFRSIVGIEQINDIDVAVYPNPTTGKLFLKSSGSTMQDIQLFGVMGKLLYQENDVNKTEAEIDLTSYNNGVYILQVDNKKIKIVKQ